MSREFLFFAIVALILLEVTHLKWFWWNYGVCNNGVQRVRVVVRDT